MADGFDKILSVPPAASAQGFDSWLRSHRVYSTYVNPSGHEERLVLASLRDAWEASQEASRSYEDGVRECLAIVQHYRKATGFYEDHAIRRLDWIQDSIKALLPPPQEGGHAD